VNHPTLKLTWCRWVNNLRGPPGTANFSSKSAVYPACSGRTRFSREAKLWKCQSMGLFARVSLESTPRRRFYSRKDTLDPHPLLSFWQSVNKDSTISSCQWCHLGLCPWSLYLQARSNRGAAAPGASLRKLARISGGTSQPLRVPTENRVRVLVAAFDCFKKYPGSPRPETLSWREFAVGRCSSYVCLRDRVICVH
jgi:hypothetical protein